MVFINFIFGIRVKFSVAILSDLGKAPIANQRQRGGGGLSMTHALQARASGETITRNIFLLKKVILPC